MSSKGLLPYKISRPFKLQPRSSKAVKAPSTSPITPVASKRSQQPTKKSKPSACRRLLNFFKKGVPCTSSTAHSEEEQVDDYLDVIDISPRFNEESFSAAVSPSPGECEEAPEPSTLSPSSSPSSSSVDTTPHSTPKSPFGSFFRKHKGNSATQSPRQIALSIEPPFATQGDSFYQMPELNDAPTIEHIHRLSIYDCPSSGNDATPREEHKALEAFLRAYPTNIYDASISRVVATKSTKVAPHAAVVESKQVKSGVSPVYVIVRGEQRKEPETSRPVSRRWSFSSHRTITTPKYVMRDGEVTFDKRKRFMRYKHIQTLTAVEDEDEGVEDDSSASSANSDSDSIPSPVDDDLCTPPVSVEDLECEEVEEDKPLPVDIDVPRPRLARRVAVYGEDQLMASLSLPIMSTARRPPPVDWRPTGLRPLLLPIHVALRDATIHGPI